MFDPVSIVESCDNFAGLVAMARQLADRLNVVSGEHINEYYHGVIDECERGDIEDSDLYLVETIYYLEQDIASYE